MWPELRGRVLERDGLWTRTRAGATELKVIRDENGVALGAFGNWAGVIDQAWRQGVVQPAHLMSDGDAAIAAGIRMVYRPASAPPALPFSPAAGVPAEHWGEGLASSILAEARGRAARVAVLTGGQGTYWCRKALREGLRHLATGHARFKMTSR